MSGSDPSLPLFAQALVDVGVPANVVEQAVCQSSNADGLGLQLSRMGAATLRQLEAARARWAQTFQAPPPAKRLGPFSIERRLGIGGCGEVYLVRDPTTGARLAAKRLLDLGDPAERARFAREAELLARLRHPHVARVHTADLAGPVPYFVLDYCGGGTLAERLTRGPLEPEAARALLLKLADALGAAHAAGVLHRDLKPENVLFDDQDRPQLTDFGIGGALAPRADRLTQTGEILGTPSYMPPEQALDAKRADARSDVYGLGALLYACLTGAPPIPPRSSLFATLEAVVSDPVVPPSALGVQVPPDLEATCLRALEKDPTARFPDARAFATALATSAPPARRAVWPLVFSALALGGVAVGLLWLKTRPTSGPTAPAPAAASPSPSDPLLEVRAALARGDGRTAWRTLTAQTAPPGDLVLEVLAALPSLETLQPDEEVSLDTVQQWRSLWRVRAHTHALRRCALDVAVVAEDKRRAVEEAWRTLQESLQSLVRRDPRPAVATPVVVAALDAFVYAYETADRVLRGRLGRLKLEFPSQGWAEALQALEWVEAMIGRDSYASREQTLVLNERLDALASHVDPWISTWPVYLGGRILAQAQSPPGVVRVDLTRAWWSRLPPAERLEGQPVAWLELLALLAYGLTQPAEDGAPADLGLARELLARAESLRSLQLKSAGASDFALTRLAAVWLALGQPEEAQAMLDLGDNLDYCAPLRAALDVERARRREPGPEREVLLSAAEERLVRLDARYPSQVAGAIRVHLRRLSAEPERFAALPAWAELPVRYDRHLWVVAPWYLAPAWRQAPGAGDPWLPPLAR